MLKKGLEVLLVEDEPADVDLMRHLLEEAKIMVNLKVVDDGAKALAYLRQERPYADAVRPDLILLDLNLPKKDGREVLGDIKSDQNLKHVPVIVLTTSEADEDIAECYDLGANCYVSKPNGLNEFSRIVRSIGNFWLTVAKLPPRKQE